MLHHRTGSLLASATQGRAHDLRAPLAHQRAVVQHSGFAGRHSVCSYATGFGKKDGQGAHDRTPAGKPGKPSEVLGAVEDGAEDVGDVVNEVFTGGAEAIGDAISEAATSVSDATGLSTDSTGKAPKRSATAEPAKAKAKTSGSQTSSSKAPAASSETTPGTVLDAGIKAVDDVNTTAGEVVSGGAIAIRDALASATESVSAAATGSADDASSSARAGSRSSASGAPAKPKADTTSSATKAPAGSRSAPEPTPGGVFDAVARAADDVNTVVGEVVSGGAVTIGDAFIKATESISDATGVNTKSAEAGTKTKSKAYATAAEPGETYSSSSTSTSWTPSGSGGSGVSEPSPELAPYVSQVKGLTVLVAGATGRTGKAVVEALVASGAKVVALVRDAKAARETFFDVLSSEDTKDQIKIVSGDVFQYATLPPAFKDGVNAVVVATGASDPRDPLGPFNVDFQGTLNLLAAAKRYAKVKRFVLVSSIGADDLINPLNLFWGVLFWKKRAEEEVQRSGLDYVIVRPGGLKTKLKGGEVAGQIVMKPGGTYGVPPLKQSGAILRSQVADVSVAALVDPEAANKVVEIIATKEAKRKTLASLFKNVSY